MSEGQDYGKVPGCGDKPGLFQPGAQKLSMMFQLNPCVQQEIVTDYPNFHRGYRLVVRVTNGNKFADGVGECSTMEAKYRYRNGSRKCPACGKETIIKGKEEFGGGWLCFPKKGGCGWKCVDGSAEAKSLISQETGKVEHDNPADFWNTVRKMAFKRAFVHGIINATNTSELWSQDLEDLAANGVINAQEAPPSHSEAPKAQSAQQAPKTPPEPPRSQETTFTGDWRNFRVPYGKNKDKQLGKLSEQSLAWYCENIDDKNKAFRGALNAAAEELKDELPM